jgi:uroporphyrinogen III methyltransferase/synthase
MPTEYTGLQLGRQLTAKFDCTGKKILLLRSAIATKELAQELAAAGAHVDDVAVYTTMTKSGAAESVISVLEEGKADWITFTSSSTVRGFFEQVSADLVRAARVKIASIGPATTLELHTLGFEPEIEAAEHTGSGLVKALTEYIKSGAMHRD